VRQQPNLRAYTTLFAPSAIGMGIAAAVIQHDTTLPTFPAAADGVAKWIAFVALFAIVGAGIFAFFSGIPASQQVRGHGADFARAVAHNTRRIVVVATVVLALATLYEIISATAGLGRLSDVDQLLLHSRNGFWLIVRLSLITTALALAASWPHIVDRSARAAPAAIILVGLALIVTFASRSHTSTLPNGQIWAIVFDALHLTGIAVWAGALAVLSWVVWRTRRLAPDADRRTFQMEAVRRFSWIAAAMVPLFLLAGGMMLLVGAPATRTLVDTDWGLAMLAKIAVTVLVLGVALTNALILRPRTQSRTRAGGPPGAIERRFTRLIRAEVSLVLVALVAASLITQLTPPRRVLAVEAQRARNIERTLPIDDLIADLHIRPARPGLNTYTIVLNDADGIPTTEQIDTVDIRFVLQSRPAEVSLVSVLPVGPATFEAKGTPAAPSGDWLIEIEVQRPGRDVATAQTTVSVPPLPAAASVSGALDFPITQFDWKIAAGIWAGLILGLAALYARPIVRRIARP
jgi:copper transport protein